MAVEVVENLITLVAGVIDESGSMSNVRTETINGYNSFVSSVQEEQKGKTAYVSTFLFDSGHVWVDGKAVARPQVRVLQDTAPIERLIPLSESVYSPNGTTPLYDAIGYAINAIDKAVEEKGVNKVTLVIQTDGAENSSKEYTHAQVTKMIEERNARGWQILFLGADLSNAQDIGRGLGIMASNSMSYSKSSTMDTFNAVYTGTQSYRSMRSASSASTLTDEEKAKLWTKKS